MRPGVPARVGATAVAEALALWYRAVAAPQLTASSRLEPAIATLVLAGLAGWVLSVDPLFHDTQTLPRWQALLLYPLGVVITRLAILAAAKSTARGRLLFAIGLPLGCAALGYAYATAVWQPGPGNGQALAAQAATWTTVGALVGLWFAWAVLRASQAAASKSRNWEDAIAVVLIAVLLAWIVFPGSDPLAGPDGGTATPLVFCVLGAGIIRLLLASLFERRGTLRPRLSPEIRRRLGKLWVVSLVVTAAAAVVAIPAANAAAAQCARTPGCNATSTPNTLLSLRAAVLAGQSWYESHGSFAGVPQITQGLGEVAMPSDSLVLGPDVLAVIRLLSFGGVPDNEQCVGALVVERPQRTAPFPAYPQTRAPGTYYFLSGQSTRFPFCAPPQANANHLVIGVWPMLP